jgi:hypothetical protein
MNDVKQTEVHPAAVSLVSEPSFVDIKIAVCQSLLEAMKAGGKNIAFCDPQIIR